MPDVWTNGVGAEPPVVVCGEHAHYAVARAVGEMGLGMRNALVVVPSRDWRMDVDALARDARRARRARARRVMAVVATAGSTATGSFDDLEAIGALCDERGHLAARRRRARRLGAAVSERIAHRLRGIERARSIAWDPHKMMLLPLSAGMRAGARRARSRGARSRSARRTSSTATTSAARVGSGDAQLPVLAPRRRAQAVGGAAALRRRAASARCYDRLCDVARALYERSTRTTTSSALHEPESNILCFRWVGDGSVGDEALDAINRELRERYNRSGAGWITATNLDGRRVLRVTMMNPRTTREHVRALLDGLAAEGRAIVRTRRGAGATAPSAPTPSASPATAPGVPPAGSVRS